MTETEPKLLSIIMQLPSAGNNRFDCSPQYEQSVLAAHRYVIEREPQDVVYQTLARRQKVAGLS